MLAEQEHCFGNNQAGAAADSTLYIKMRSNCMCQTRHFRGRQKKEKKVSNKVGHLRRLPHCADRVTMGGV